MTQETPLNVYVASRIPKRPDAKKQRPKIPDLKVGETLESLKVGKVLIVECPKEARRIVTHRLSAASARVRKAHETREFRLKTFWNGVSLTRLK